MSNKPDPIVSVVMPAWSAAETLAESVASVQAQSIQDWELLIVDDASTDATLARAKELAKADPRIRLLQHDVNRGAAAARNTALKVARGRYVACLDADDLWMPDKLQRQIALMEETGAALAYSAFYVENAKRRQLVSVPDQIDRATLLKSNVIGCLTAIWDRDQLGHLRFPPIRRRQDYAMWLKMLEEVPHAYGVADPLAVHRRQVASLSGNLRARLAGTWSVYREFEGMGRMQATWSLLRHTANRFRRGMRM